MAGDAFEELRQTFFEECEEQLAELESGLMQMQEGETDKEVVNAVFRAVHSVKGGAGAFDLEALVSFAHVFETTLDEIRADRLEPGEDLMKLMLRASDVLADLVAAARAGESAPEENWRGLADEIAAYANGGAPAAPKAAASAPAADAPQADGFTPAPLAIAPLGGDAAPAADAAAPAFQPMALSIPGLEGAEPPQPPAADGGDGGDGARKFHIMFRPRIELYEKANDAVRLLRELDRLGSLTVSCDTAELPSLDEIDPQGAYLAFHVQLRTDCDENAILEVFEFCEEDCDLVIREESSAAGDAPDVAKAEPPAAVADAPAAPPQAAPEPPVAAEPVKAAPPPPAAAKADKPAPAKSAAPAAPAKQADPKAAQPSAPAGATIRVDLDRVDRLINLVGELVINQAMLAQAVAEQDLSRAPAVSGGLDELDQLTREIQESVMAIRAQPLKPLFQRMGRVVREVGDATGKQVRLVTEGEWTEVDKTVVERLADPLTHMIRNAIDHGLESPEKRAASGKDPVGTVKLSAAHRSGRVVIEITDDGAGVNRERVKQRAIERELIPADAQLSDGEIDNLLFLPGFSTAETISNISGRGVGMDVVKRSIAALSGRIFVKSAPGKGSTFTMSLPLTLAVLDGMVVSVDGQTLVAPLSAIVETLSLDTGNVNAFGEAGQVLRDREGFVPLVDTGSELGFRGPRRFGGEEDKSVALLVESEGGGRSALVVDSIQDQRQVVIKSLETNYGRVGGIAAATILGDGRVALILDVDSLVARAQGDLGADSMLAAE